MAVYFLDVAGSKKVLFTDVSGNKKVSMHAACCCGTLVSDCCSDRGGIPDELTLTVTRSECAAITGGQTATLTWNAGTSQWEGTMTCSGGGTIDWVLQCQVPCADDEECDLDSLHLLWGEPTEIGDDGDGDFSCNPFFWETTEAAGQGVQIGENVCNAGCAAGDFLDVTISE